MPGQGKWKVSQGRREASKHRRDRVPSPPFSCLGDFANGNSDIQRPREGRFKARSFSSCMLGKLQTSSMPIGGHWRGFRRAKGSPGIFAGTRSPFSFARSEAEHVTSMQPICS